MQIDIIAFGQVADITGQKLTVNDNLPDTDSLKAMLVQRFPALADITFLMAVDKELIQNNAALNNNVTVALMSPFSGG